MSRKAMQVALEALESDPISHAGLVSRKQAIAVLRQALETEQEPVAWMYVNKDGECEQIEYGPVLDDPGVTPLYTAPQKRDYVIDCPRCGHCCPERTWAGLTDEEIQDLSHLYQKIDASNSPWFDRLGFARAIETKLRNKNQ